MQKKERKYLDSILSRGANNFDLIRLAAALSVMVGHSYDMHNPKGNPDVVRNFLGSDYLGSMAVYAFFLLSGILITQSFEKQKNPASYGLMRFARIWPGLAVNVLVTVFLIGPFFTVRPDLWSYLSDEGTLQYLTTNIAHIGAFEGFIPSLFQHNALKGAVNFPLWTLIVEAQCYILVFVIGVAGLIRRPVSLLVTLLIFLAAFLFAAPYEAHGPITIFFLHKFDDYGFYPVPFFLLGIVAYTFRRHVILDWRAAIALTACYLALRHTEAAKPILYFAFAYDVLVIGSFNWLARIRPSNDYSYGIYIYGFICMQITESVWPASNRHEYLAASILMALGFAMLSWHLVERPVLSVFRAWTGNASVSGGLRQTDRAPQRTPYL